MTPQTQGNTPKTFVLIHGAWHGGWCWELLLPLKGVIGESVTDRAQNDLTRMYSK